MKEVRIVVNCDEGHVADTLRAIAALYNEESEWIETEHGCASIEEVTRWDS